MSSFVQISCEPHNGQNGEDSWEHFGGYFQDKKSIESPTHPTSISALHHSHIHIARTHMVIAISSRRCRCCYLIAKMSLRDNFLDADAVVVLLSRFLLLRLGLEVRSGLRCGGDRRGDCDCVERWMAAGRKEGRKAKPYLDLFQRNKSRTKKNDAKSATDGRTGTADQTKWLVGGGFLGLQEFSLHFWSNHMYTKFLWFRQGKEGRTEQSVMGMGWTWTVFLIKLHWAGRARAVHPELWARIARSPPLAPYGHRCFIHSIWVKGFWTALYSDKPAPSVRTRASVRLLILDSSRWPCRMGRKRGRASMKVQSN